MYSYRVTYLVRLGGGPRHGSSFRGTQLLHYRNTTEIATGCGLQVQGGLRTLGAQSGRTTCGPGDSGRRASGGLAERLRKGAQIYLEGQLHSLLWQDDAGRRRWRTEVIARRASGILLGAALAARQARESLIQGGQWDYLQEGSPTREHAVSAYGRSRRGMHEPPNRAY